MLSVGVCVGSWHPGIGRGGPGVVLRLPSSRCAFTGGRLSGSLAFQTCLQLLALHLHGVLQPLDFVAGEGVEVQGSDHGWLPAVLTPSVRQRWCCVSANPQGWQERAGRSRQAGRLCDTGVTTRRRGAAGVRGLPAAPAMAQQGS